MDTIKGYGVIIRNTPIEEKNTVAYQELTTLGLEGNDAVIDIVRADSSTRPKLEQLISTLSDGDRIDMYSVDTLLQGDSKKADEYYSAILSKGIGLLIFDFSGAIARLSPFSTYRFGDRFQGEDLLVKKNPPYDMIIETYHQGGFSMNAVIYARYSSDRQREESIEGQIRECTDYAMRNNLTLIGTYVDRALSARTADRPDFQRMIADSAKGLFDVVLVWKLDRFSRDRYDSAHYKHVLKKNGVRVISIKENISDGPEGIILESMLEGYAEYYSAELAQKIRRGQHDNAMKCMNNGGNTPLGYYVDKATGRLEVNPETAPYVQELFARYADGERLTVLQAEMEERGLRSRRGNAYTVSVLSNLLKNRKYIGEYKYGDVITPDGIPAIIDKELFERVQMRMAANKKAPARAKAEEEYLLTTKLYCGDCGRLMAGESGKGCKGIVYHYYKCSGAKRRLGCKKKAIKKHWIEETVVKLTVSKVLTDEAIDRIADAILVMQEQGDTMTPVLKQQLQQCEAEIRNVMKAIRQGIITETTKECLEDLETQRDSLKASILQLQLERRKFTKEEIVEWISKYKYGNINDLDYRKEIIDTFVNSVFVYDDKLVLTYNYKDGTETLTLQEIESVLSSNLTSMCPP